jgi:hypothetical protein
MKRQDFVKKVVVGLMAIVFIIPSLAGAAEQAKKKQEPVLETSKTTIFAEGIKVTDSQREYVVKIVSAEKVKGVEVRLSKEIIIYDCNRRTLDLTSALVSGNGVGWYDKYFFDVGMMKTLMNCPLEKPITETVYSKTVFIKAFTNENVNGEVIATIVIPKGYELEVVAVK